MPKENTHLFAAHKIINQKTKTSPKISTAKRATRPISSSLTFLTKKNIPQDLAFLFGYLTHPALDITFHPIIYYFSGNYYYPNPKKRAQAVYLYRHLETYLDKKLNSSFFIHKLIQPSLLKNLSFPCLLAQKGNLPPRKIHLSLSLKKNF